MKRINFFQEVKIKETAKNKIYRGKLGAVLGISEDDKGVFGYAIALDDYNTTVYFQCDELEETGNYRKKSDYY